MLFRTIISVIFISFCFSFPLAADEDFEDAIDATFLGKFNPSNGSTFEGEHIDIRTGALYWETTDLSIPGNGGLDIVVSRSFNKTATPPFKELANWTLEVPRIILALKDIATRGEEASRIGGWRGDLCGNPYASDKKDFWSGLQLVIPGDPPRELFFKSKEITQYPEAAEYVTTDHWLVECYASEAQEKHKQEMLAGPYRKVWPKYHLNDKDSFLVKAPDGRRFWLELVERQRGLPAWIIIKAAKVEDKHGNRLSYHYQLAQPTGIQQQQLQKITSSDGRLVEFAYRTVPAGRTTYPIISKITANQQEWLYDYQAGLSAVTRPDGQSFKYRYEGPSIFVYDYRYRMPYVSHIETPAGALIDYTFQGIRAKNFGGTKSKLEVPALFQRTQKGSHLKDTVWKYQFSSRNGFNITTVESSEAKEVHEFYSIGDWQLGLPYSKSIYNPSETTPIRQEVHQWQGLSQIGETGVYRKRFTFLNQGIPKVLTKTTVNDYYTTENTNFDAYGNAKTIIETGTDTRTTLKNYLNRTNPWLVGFPKDEMIEGGGKIDRDYDERGNLITLNEFGLTTFFDYHPTGDLKAKRWIKDGQEQSITFEDYHRGQAQTVLYPDNIITKKDINDTGTVTSETDGEGHITSFEYDGLNRVTKITPPAGDATTIDWKTPRTKLTARGTYQETILLDALERPIQKSELDTLTNQKILTKTEYDTQGRIIFQSDPSEGEPPTGIKTTYDGQNRPLTLTHTGDNSTTTYCYDCKSTKRPVTTITHPNGSKTVLSYLAFGDPDNKQLVKLQEGNKTTTLSRNTLGLVTEIQQGNVSRKLIYGSERPKLLAKRYDPEIGWTSFSYDEVGNKTGEKLEEQAPTKLTYDANNRLTKIDYPSGTDNILYRYNNNHQVTDLKAGETHWNYLYDDNNQLLQESLQLKQGETETLYRLRYHYNALGHLEKTTYPTGLSFSYQPDSLGRPKEMGSLVQNINYYPNGQLKSYLTQNALQTTIEENKRHWPEKITTTKDNQAVLTQTYAYDKQGNIKRFNQEALEYDTLNQLTHAQGPYGEAKFKYDELGNITQKTIGSETLNYSYGVDNKLANSTGSQTIGLAYDNKGNIVKKNNQLFAFDEANRLTVLINADPKVTYHYDGNGHRTITQKGDDKTLSVHNKAGQLIYEETPTQKSTYLYLNQQLMARVDHETAGNQLTYYHTDLLGSPIAASNNQGNLLWKQDYKPYGERLDKGNKDNHQWYTGKTEDKETGFIYLNARHYDPEMARFISVDPVYFTEQNTQSFNRYTYANNNPYKYSDPDGQLAFLIPALASAAWTGYDTYSAYQQAGGGQAGLIAGGKSLAMGGAMTLGFGLAGRGLLAARSLRWGPLNGPGPLGEKIASTFRGGSYTESVTSEMATLYRSYGGKAGEIGKYWTRTAPTGPLQSRIDSALNPTWGNTASKTATINVPPGVKMYEGFAAPQGGLVGGSSQVYIEKVNPKWLSR